MTTETELRHLLEMAARALGIRGTAVELWAGGPIRLIVGETDNDTVIDLLGDDGDNARMRSALGIDVRWIYSWERIAKVECRWHWTGSTEILSDHNNDRNAALRLCALRVAAEIGEGMK